jgi:hypothetical protein
MTRSTSRRTLGWCSRNASAGGGPHERDRGNPGDPLRGRQAQADGAGGVLVVGHHDPSDLTDGLHPAHRVVAGEFCLHALAEPVDLGRVDPSELDVGVASSRRDPSGTASRCVEKTAERVEKVHGSPGDHGGCEEPM